MSKHTIICDGYNFRAIYSDETADIMISLGRIEIRRASHVEPVCGGAGWVADMGAVGGPVLGPFPRRDQALRREVAYLEVAGIPVPEVRR